MIAVDTNVLIRLLVDEPSQPQQVVLARQLALEAGRVHVALIVLVEAVWVLESCYQVSKAELVDVLKHLLSNDAFELEAVDRCSAALALFTDGGAGFADCLILAEAQARGQVLHTFDKRLARMSGAKRVG